MKSFEEIEEYAHTHYVPIARTDFIDFLKDLIIKNHYSDILEVGSAIGYTTCKLALMDNVYVTTIEYNVDRFKLCLENIHDFNVENKVSAINDMAENVFLSLKFDVIFIDAAKRKNITFFEQFKNNLRKDGVIIIDNLDLADFKRVVSKEKAAFYDKVNQNLKDYLDHLEDFDVTYLEIGDGIALIKKKQK